MKKTDFRILQCRLLLLNLRADSGVSHLPPVRLLRKSLELLGAGRLVGAGPSLDLALENVWNGGLVDVGLETIDFL